MAKYTDADLETLRSRCIRAVGCGFRLAHESVMINQLGAETHLKDAPYGVRKGSTRHLLYLVEEAQAQRAGKPKPAKPATPAPAKPVAKPVAVAEPEPEEDVPPYEDWDVKELYAEAKARDISGRSNMSKDELVAALYNHDEEND